MSGRNRDLRLNLGNVMSEAFSDLGDAGGHATMAAASIPLHVFSSVREKKGLLEMVIERHFAELLPTCRATGGRDR